MNKQIRVFLAEDQTILRDSLCLLINAEPDLKVVGQASDGEEAVHKVGKLRPDIVVMDLSMPVMDGVQATQAIKQAYPEIKVVILTVDEGKSQIRRVIQAGASGYVVKRSAAEELIQALRTVAVKGVYLDTIAAAKLLGPAKPSRVAESKVAVLSDREAEVIQLIALGFANKEIAAQLELSVKTVETFKTRSMEKLGLRSRVDIVRYAVDHGWLSPKGSA